MERSLTLLLEAGINKKRGLDIKQTITLKSKTTHFSVIQTSLFLFNHCRNFFSIHNVEQNPFFTYYYQILYVKLVRTTFGLPKPRVRRDYSPEISPLSSGQNISSHRDNWLGTFVISFPIKPLINFLPHISNSQFHSAEENVMELFRC